MEDRISHAFAWLDPLLSLPYFSHDLVPGSRFASRHRFQPRYCAAVPGNDEAPPFLELVKNAFRFQVQLLCRHRIHDTLVTPFRCHRNWFSVGIPPSEQYSIYTGPLLLAPKRG